MQMETALFLEQRTEAMDSRLRADGRERLGRGRARVSRVNQGAAETGSEERPFRPARIYHGLLLRDPD